jgi:hypothetical protein
LNKGKWQFTGYYGFPEGRRRCASWDFLRNLANNTSLPWCILGDFNDILDAREKRGGAIRPRWLINGFRHAVFDAGLTEVYMKGYPYTWFKSLGTPRAVEVKLDRALANADWFRMFPNVMVENLVAPASDHYPLLLKKEESQRIWVPRQSFKFENAWCVEPGIYDIVSDSWSSSAGMQVVDKLTTCANDLSSWNKANRNGLKQELENCRRELNRCRNQGAAADPNTLTNLRKRMTHF